MFRPPKLCVTMHHTIVRTSASWRQRERRVQTQQVVRSNSYFTLLGEETHTFGMMEDAINFLSSWLQPQTQQQLQEQQHPMNEETLHRRTTDESHVHCEQHKSSTHIEFHNNENDDTITSYNMKSSLSTRSNHRTSDFTPGQSLRRYCASLPARQALAEEENVFDIAVISDYSIPNQESSSCLSPREKHSEKYQQDKPTLSSKTRRSRHSDFPPVKMVVSKPRLSEVAPPDKDVIVDVRPPVLSPVKVSVLNPSESQMSAKRTNSTKSSSCTDEKMPDEEGYIPLDKRIHFSWMPFGRARTGSAIGVTLLGLILAILSKRSLQFVKLQKPLDMSLHFANVTNVGMVRLELCYSNDNNNNNPCFILPLSTTIIEDTMWDISRLSTSMAIAMGTFFCLFMILTIRWESINMKPIAIGLLITYLFQSFSFFFYDSRLCQQHSCLLGTGTVLSILASICWFAAAMIAILMDVHHTKKIRRLARRERRRRRRLERTMKRKATTDTEISQTTTSNKQDYYSSSVHFDSNPVPAVATKSHLDEGKYWHV